MGWIDLKYKQAEGAQEARQQSTANAAQLTVDRNAVGAKAWDKLIAALRADVAYYNEHPKTQLERRVELLIPQHPRLVELHWRGKTMPLLHIEQKKEHPAVFSYVLRSGKSTGPERDSGEIGAESDSEFVVNDRGTVKCLDAAGLSEELLSPVLFPNV
jgi:hypothetical protein